MKADLNRILSRWPAIAGISFVLFSLGALGVEITKIDIRFALMVQDMALHGVGVFPTVNGVEYGDYPSGWVLASYLTTFGGHFAARWLVMLPAILAGTFIVTMTYLAGERVEKNAGLLAAVFLMVTPEFIHFVSGFGIDVPVAAAGAAMLYLFQSKTPNRVAGSVWVLLLIFCFWVRGPMGLILLGAGTGGYLLASRRFKEVLLFGFLGLAAAVFCGALWYWAVHRQGGETLWQEFLLCQIGKRMGDSNYLEYFTNGLPSFAPVSLLALAVFFLPRREVLSNPVAGWLGFILLPLLILSVPGCKHLRYLGLTLPAFALLAAYAWNGRRPWCFVRERLGRFVRLLFRAVPPLAFLGVLGLATAGCFLMEPSLLPWWHFLLAALLIGIVSRLPLASVWKTTLPLMIFLTVALIPFEAALENSADFVSRVNALRRGTVYFYELGPDHDDLKYVYSTLPEERGHIRYLFDAKRRFPPAIKRMYPYMTCEEGIAVITGDDLVILRDRPKERESLLDLAGQYGRRVETVQAGSMGHRDFLAVRLTEKKSETAAAL